MSLTKREFILSSTAAGDLGLSSLSQAGAASAAFSPQPGPWRRFEVTTTLDLSAHDGAVQAWVPVPSFSADSWMRPGETMWSGDGAEVSL